MKTVKIAVVALMLVFSQNSWSEQFTLASAPGWGGDNAPERPGFWGGFLSERCLEAEYVKTGRMIHTMMGITEETVYSGCKRVFNFDHFVGFVNRRAVEIVNIQGTVANQAAQIAAIQSSIAGLTSVTESQRKMISDEISKLTNTISQQFQASMKAQIEAAVKAKVEQEIIRIREE